MLFDRGGSGLGALPSVTLCLCLAMAESTYADGATRDLSQYSAPGVTFTVSITMDPPPETGVAGVEEAPPTGWPVANISNNGTWDTENERVKFGPFFSTSIPQAVTYDVTPPGDATGMNCFWGFVYFDAVESTIEGNECVGDQVPTLSHWGMIVFAVLMVSAGTGVLARRRRVPAE